MSSVPFEILAIDAATRGLYHNLAQAYEAEFSALTRKVPGPDGRFPLDTPLGEGIRAYILLLGGVPAGLAAVAVQGESRSGEGRFEMCEFYIVPCFRGQAWGQRFAHGLWRLHPGAWEIKQIAGADKATAFWHKTLQAFPGADFLEDRYEDSYWGPVTRQRFAVRAEAGRLDPVPGPHPM